MASQAQIKFFDQCLEEREFPTGQDPNSLRTQFAPLSTNAASEWIDKALKLPKKDAATGDNSPPPF
jgi:hypothetical protein